MTKRKSQHKKRKVAVVLIARANYARIKSALRAIQKHPNLELQVIVGASMLLESAGFPYKQVEADGFKISAKMYSTVEGGAPIVMVKSVSLAMLELSSIFNQLQPDIVLTVADRYETLATAITAAYMNIPLAHTQGGEVTGTIDESVRHAVTKLAHIHFPASKASAQRVIKMGEPKDTVHLTGGPEMDIITGIDLSLPQDFFKQSGGVGVPLDQTKPYVLLVQHPVTTEYGSGIAQIKETIQAVYELNIPVAILWPNIDAGADQISKGFRTFREKHPDAQFHFYKNFSPENYARIMYNSVCVVGNSSSFIREGSYLGVPAVLVGTRQAGREHGKNIKTVGYDKTQIKRAILSQIKHGRYQPEYIFGFGDGKAGERIAKVLATCDLSVQKQLKY